MQASVRSGSGSGAFSRSGCSHSSFPRPSSSYSQRSVFFFTLCEENIARPTTCPRGPKQIFQRRILDRARKEGGRGKRREEGRKGGAKNEGDGGSRLVARSSACNKVGKEAIMSGPRIKNARNSEGNGPLGRVMTGPRK